MTGCTAAGACSQEPCASPHQCVCLPAAHTWPPEACACRQAASHAAQACSVQTRTQASPSHPHACMHQLQLHATSTSPDPTATYHHPMIQASCCISTIQKNPLRLWRILPGSAPASSTAPPPASSPASSPAPLTLSALSALQGAPHSSLTHYLPSINPCCPHRGPSLLSATRAMHLTGTAQP